MHALANIMSEIFTCPYCKAEVFYDKSKDKLGVSHVCWRCQKSIPHPAIITIGENRAVLARSAVLHAHTFTGNYDMNTVVGRLVQNPNNQIFGAFATNQTKTGLPLTPTVPRPLFPSDVMLALPRASRSTLAQPLAKSRIDA